MNRRGLIIGGLSLLAAPAIVHARNLMPLRVRRPPGTFTFDGKDFTAEFWYYPNGSLMLSRFTGPNGIIEQRNELREPHPLLLKDRA
jgi:hypothetical protein